MSRKTTEPTTQARRTSGGEHLYRSPSRSTYCDQMSTVYVLRAKGTNLVKIGFTAGDVEERRRALQTGCPHELVVELTFAGTMEDERRAHAIHHEQRLVGEWFQLDPSQVSGLASRVSHAAYDAWRARFAVELRDLRQRFSDAFGDHADPGTTSYLRSSIELFCSTVAETAFDPDVNGQSGMCLHCHASSPEEDDAAEDNFGHERGCPVPWLERAVREIRRGKT